MTAAATLAEALAPLRADPARAAVLLDVDGTLAPIVRHSADAHVPEPTRTLLIDVARRYGLVACVSGRQATEARRIVALGSIVYLGNHGAERLAPGAVEPELDRRVLGWAERIQAFAADALTPEVRRTRVRTEDKGVIVAFHWRETPDEDAARAALEVVAQRAESQGLHTHWGRKVLEVRPAVRIDKGTGVVGLLADADLDAALYAGDDATDLDAFRGLDELVEHGRLGCAVRVGVRSDEGPPEIEEAADAVVDGPRGVRELLDALLAD